MKVELSLYASNLKNAAGFGKTSDPFAVVTHIATDSGAKPSVIGRTETLQNTLSPHWIKVFVLDYELGSPMKLVVSMFDEGKKESKSMGSSVFDVGELLGARGNTKAKRIHSGGTLFANIRKSEGSGLLRLAVKGHALENTEGFMRKSDPFFELSRQLNAAGALSWDNVHRSATIHDSLDPSWSGSVVELSILCGGNQDLPIKFSVYDFESKGDHVPMGSFETSVNGLLQAAGKRLPLTLKGKQTGEIEVVKAEVAGLGEEEPTAAVTEQVAAMSVQEKTAMTSKPSFFDYVAGGCELNVVVGIDFTGSNGDPRKAGTLHHLDDHSDNPYEKAISSIVEILSKYDTDKSFPVFGFGAKYDGVVRHCFQAGDTEEARGVDGVMAAYRSVFKSGLIMSSPTDFTEVIKTAADRASRALAEAQSKGGLAYTILLIVSDGAVTDVDATAECLKGVSDGPLSIVIVGVGDADFSGMEFLDDIPGMHRDLAQFVQFNRHPHKNDLTKVTLHEIPDQLTGYFASKGIQPGNPIVTKEADIIIEDEEEEIDLTLDLSEPEIVLSGGGFDTRGAW